MNVKEIRELYSAAPFQPLEMVLTNGAKVQPMRTTAARSALM